VTGNTKYNDLYCNSFILFVVAQLLRLKITDSDQARNLTGAESREEDMRDHGRGKVACGLTVWAGAAVAASPRVEGSRQTRDGWKQTGPEFRQRYGWLGLQWGNPGQITSRQESRLESKGNEVSTELKQRSETEQGLRYRQ
uniref:Uncharacterized protein n=1 Tax=Amphiprion percula TaxID=161767 RepID=A0A3P8TG32_AMPPE